VGVTIIAIGYFVPPFDTIVASMHEFHFLGIVFSWLLIMMLVIGELYPRETEFEQQDVGAVDMTPWRFAKPVGLLLIVIVISIYSLFADFSVLGADADQQADTIEKIELSSASLNEPNA
jgi:SSS family solute:Na+ symporter